MDKIFTQEELYWLDDILPGTKVGKVRRFSVTRNIHIPKKSENKNGTVSFSLLKNILSYFKITAHAIRYLIHIIK
jgi:hypothetical protein